jgi:hypothetical protein
MQCKIKNLWLNSAIIALFYFQPALAQDTANQCNNEGFSFTSKELILNTDNNAGVQRLFIIKNVGGYTVLVNHNTPNTPGAHAGWASKIDGGNASAIAINQPNFSLFCMGYKPPQFGVVNCQSVLSVCAYPPLKNGVGNFWVAENKSLEDVEKALVQRKIM